MAAWDDCPWLQPYFISPTAAGRYLGLSLPSETLGATYRAGRGPASVQLGPWVVFTFEALDRFTDEAGGRQGRR